jgi:anti-anti-sigma factor
LTTQSPFSVCFEQFPDSVVAHTAGEIDISTVPMLSEALDRALEQSRPSLFTLDLSEVTFIDASGLHELLSVHEQCEAGGCSLRIQCSAIVRRLAHICCIEVCSN